MKSECSSQVYIYIYMWITILKLSFLTKVKVGSVIIQTIRIQLLSVNESSFGSLKSNMPKIMLLGLSLVTKAKVE